MGKRTSDTASSTGSTKLARLGKSSYVSQTGIEALVKDLKRHGVPESSSRRSQYRARKAVCGISNDYGPLIKELKADTLGGKTVDIAIQSPLAMIAYLAEHSLAFAATAHRVVPGRGQSIRWPQ